ncbi:hypothetical protein [Thermosulfurimonas dismutans]|uniref:Uncharacterized protein n=1 Tax=Thermosulfurimonas dismutans TaxID=999894 RepID=A0A179D3W8_9BACT|nr:hypothetical protein [Thermosulfurimonas dismutans]OAQ20770.1 hypothetical protein TDIS_1059 [Thermosulfurimonas dismutans]
MKKHNPFPEELLEEIQNWENFTPKNLLTSIFNGLALAHRAIHLKKHPHDKGNGFYERTLQIGGSRAYPGLLGLTSSLFPQTDIQLYKVGLWGLFPFGTGSGLQVWGAS